MECTNKIKQSEFDKAFNALDKKIQALKGADGLIDLNIKECYDNDCKYPKGSTYVYPSYGFHGIVNGDMQERVANFAKALSKACTMCKNFKYNGYYVFKDEFYDNWVKSHKE